MKSAIILRLLAVASTTSYYALAMPAAEAANEPVKQRDIHELWRSLPRDASGGGVTHLGADGVLRTLNKARDVLGEVQLTKDEIADFRARAPKVAADAATVSKPRAADEGSLFKRACNDYPCDEDEDCDVIACRDGCWNWDTGYRCYGGN